MDHKCIVVTSNVRLVSGAIRIDLTNIIDQTDYKKPQFGKNGEIILFQYLLHKPLKLCKMLIMNLHKILEEANTAQKKANIKS